MTIFLSTLIVGLASGALYGLTAMGLVLTYKTSGVFNFAHGATGAAAAYLYYQLKVKSGVPTVIALIITLFIAAPIAGLLLERMGRRLAGATTANKVVATIGLALAVQGLLTYHFTATALSFPNVLPTQSVKIGAVFVGYDQIISFVLALAIAVGLYLFFRLLPLGVQMRAVVDDPDLLALSGTSATRVRGTAWVLGSIFASMSGILLAPTVGLDATLLTLIVLQAFGAAAIGTFSSLPLSYAGGLVIGILSKLSLGYLSQYNGLADLSDAVPFIVLFAVLLFVPTKRLVESGGKARAQAPPRSILPERVRLAGGGLFVVAAFFAPELVGAKLPVYSDMLCFVVIFASLNLLVRTSGQVSLCHAGLAAIGAASFSHFAVDLHVPWLIALVLAGLVTVPVGALIAIPAIRLSGLYLALATFGYGVLLEKLVYPLSSVFGKFTSLRVPRPAGFTSDRSFYYVLLAVALAACATVGAVNRTRLGRLLRGMSDSPTALETLGLSVNATKVLVFCVSSFLAGIGGAVFVARAQTADSIPFISFNSLVWLAVLAISGRGRQSAAVIAAFVLEVLPSFTTDPKLGLLFTPSFGVIALIAALVASRPRTAEATAAGAANPAVPGTTGYDRVTLRGRVGPVGARLAFAAGISR